MRSKNVGVTEVLAPTISTARLRLVAMTPELLAVMRGDAHGPRPFAWPEWWPDDADRTHLCVWHDRAVASELNVQWGARALVDNRRQMVGHAGFHLPPQPLDRALADPTFVGARDPVGGGVVEVGYTIFPDARGRGYATEAVTALIDRAGATGEVGAVLAAIAEHNDASVRVLNRVGGFRKIGTCRADDAIEVVYRRDL